MDLIQSFIAIPEAAAKKQAQQITAASTTQQKRLADSQASTTVQVLLFKQHNEPKSTLDQDYAVDLKAV